MNKQWFILQIIQLKTLYWLNYVLKSLKIENIMVLAMDIKIFKGRNNFNAVLTGLF